MGVLKEKILLLWENASPGSSFKAQTIALDLSNYEFVYVEFRESTSSSVKRIKRIAQGHTGRGHIEYNWKNTRNTTVKETGVTFEDGHRIGYETEATNGNDYCIPTRIWGVT